MWILYDILSCMGLLCIFIRLIFLNVMELKGWMTYAVSICVHIAVLYIIRKC